MQNYAEGDHNYLKHNEIRVTLENIIVLVSVDVDSEPAVWLMESRSFFYITNTADEHAHINIKAVFMR